MRISHEAIYQALYVQGRGAPVVNEKWAADISYIWTAQGWLYLAVMLDLYSRRVIGWAVDAIARTITTLPAQALA